MPIVPRSSPTASPVAATAGPTAAFGHRSPSSNRGHRTPLPGAQKQVVLAGHKEISRRSFSPLNRMSKSILASISPIPKSSPATAQPSSSAVTDLCLRGRRWAAATASAVTTPPERMNSQCKPSKIVLSIQSPDGRTLVREEIRVGDNAHLDDNISVVTILDAIGFGQYAELFEIKQIPVEQLLSMSCRDLEAIPEIGQANAALLSRALQRL